MDTPGRFCRHFVKERNFCRQEVTDLVFETFQKMGAMINVLNFIPYVLGLNFSIHAVVS